MVEEFFPQYPLTVGDLVDGKYQIDSVLGEGGMGVVFAATHVELHCPVALKVIRHELNQEPELIARLVFEARAAAQIKSEHVCRVLDVGRLETGAPYMVMEHLRGTTLARVVRTKGRLPERQAVDYLLQACEAVAEAHRSGVIHRDLKPENLFLAEFPDGHRAIKVLDFGISKTTGVLVKSAGQSLTNPSSAMGSPHYMAPEQMSAAHDVDARADIWALGAILHELLTGRLAFEGDSLPVVCAAVLQSNPVPVRHYEADLSEGLETAILECLTNDRERRPSSTADLADKIAPYGSAKAAESALRIRRLLSESPVTSPSSEDRSGTLVSPQKALTPRTPIQQGRVMRTPVETAAALTSSKESSAFGASGAGRSRYRWYLVAAGLLVIPGTLVFVRAPFFSSADPASAPTPTSGYTSRSNAATPVVESSQSAGTSGHDDPNALQLQAPEVQASAGSVVPRVTSIEPDAGVGKSTANSTTIGPRTRHTNTQTSKVATPTVTQRAKVGATSKRDPYDSDNFGGRR